MPCDSCCYVSSYWFEVFGFSGCLKTLHVGGGRVLIYSQQIYVATVVFVSVHAVVISGVNVCVHTLWFGLTFASTVTVVWVVLEGSLSLHMTLMFSRARCLFPRV